MGTVATCERTSKAAPEITAELQVSIGDGENFGVVTLGRGGDVSDYYLHPVDSDWGRAYRVTKIGTQVPTVYDVLVDARTGEGHCDCKGCLRWGSCRHVRGLLKLLREGKLEPVQHSPASDPRPEDRALTRAYEVLARIVQVWTANLPVSEMDEAVEDARVLLMGEPA